MRMMKYKEVVKNAKSIRCLKCGRECKPQVFRAHLKINCIGEKENHIEELMDSPEIEVADITYHNTMEVRFLV